MNNYIQGANAANTQNNLLKVNDDGSINIITGASTSVKTSSTTAVISVTCTRPDNATAYAISDVCGTDPATNMAFASIGTAGKTLAITDCQLEIGVNAVPSGMAGFRLHLYNAAPTAIADNAAYNLIAADRAKYLGNIFIPTPDDLGDTLVVHVTGLNLFVKLVTTTLYGVLETLAVYTPTAQSVKVITLTALEV